MRREIPLSALADVPATDDTCITLRSLGVVVPPGLSELGAQHLLALRGAEAGAALPRPACFGVQYAQVIALCAGCPFAASCWAADTGYLTALRDRKVEPPAGVPASAVAERLAKLVVPLPLPRSAKAPPPLPGA